MKRLRQKKTEINKRNRVLENRGSQYPVFMLYFYAVKEEIIFCCTFYDNGAEYVERIYLKERG